MSFYAVRLKNIRVDSTLCKEGDSFELSGLFFEYTNEFFADDLTFLLRLSYTSEFVKETVCCVDLNEVCIELVAEYFDNLLTLTFTH